MSLQQELPHAPKTEEEISSALLRAFVFLTGSCTDRHHQVVDNVVYTRTSGKLRTARTDSITDASSMNDNCLKFIVTWPWT